MYEQHFGLKNRPFRASATGPDVFVGPQTAKTMAGLKKALEVSDAVVTVTGQVGVGKTTLVNRALGALGESRVIISVGRLQLEHDEVLELLLDELGTRQTPLGTVQRFSLFRRLLKGFSDQGKRIFIVVEDAARIGTDALMELEALTAADAGVSDGANIILMGEPGIKKLLNAPELARLKQRVRFRESIAPLGSGELLAYLKHSFHNAGGDFDAIFDAGAAEQLHRNSGGIPRIVNNTTETILASAAEQKLDRITPQFITSVVADECGMTVQLQTLDLASIPPQPANDSSDADEAPQEEVPAALEEATVTATEAANPAAEEPEPEPVPEPESKSKPEPENLSDESATDNDDDDQIDELIQDTLPNLTVLAPDFAVMPTAVEPKADSDPEPVRPAPEPSAVTDEEPDPLELNSNAPGLVFEDDPTEQVDDGIPTLFNSTRHQHPVGGSPDDAPKQEPEVAKPVEVKAEEIVAEVAKVEPAPAAAAQDTDVPESQPNTTPDNTEIPAWERDPTLAELRPDLDALERAMSYSQGNDKSVEAEIPVKEPVAEVKKEAVPEITLDRAIQEKIDEATELLNKTTIDLAEITAAEEARAAEKSSTASKPEADSASNKAEQAGTETQAELQKISTELAKANTIEDVDDQMAETLFGEEFSKIAAQVAAHAAANSILPDDSANDDVQFAADESAPQMEAKPVVKPDTTDADDNNSATQRLRTVRALNGNFDPVPEPFESVVLSVENTFNAPPATSEQPESIEDQINISMTQTLKALNVRPPPTINDFDDDFDDHHDDNEKGGFFSRFRRS